MFKDKRISVILKFLSQNDSLATECLKFFFQTFDQYLIDIINDGYNFEGEHGNGYFRINFTKDKIFNEPEVDGDMLELTSIIDGSKLVLNIYYGLLNKNATPESLSRYCLMECKGVFKQEEVLGEDFEYRNAFIWGINEKGEIERNIDNMIKNKFDYAVLPARYPLRTDVLEYNYPEKVKPKLIENKYNLFGDSLLIRSGNLPYYWAYKEMLCQDIQLKRRTEFFDKGNQEQEK